MNLHTYAALCVLPAVLVGTTVTFDEPDFPAPPQQIVVKYSLDEFEAERAARESLNELAKAIPILCSDHWASQQIRRVQKENRVEGICQ